MKKKVLIYPFDRGGLTLLRNSFYPEDWEIVALAAPRGWGYDGKDAGDIDYSEKTGMVVESDFDQALNKADTVLFMKTDMPLDYDKVLKPNLFTAAQKGKSVACTLDLTESEVEFWGKQFSSNGGSFVYYNNNLDPIISEDDVDVDEERIHNAFSPLMREITVPVLMVLGFMENVSKFDIQLSALRYFQEQGYKPALITSKSYGKLGGAWPMPNFLFSTSISESKKIILFNYYVSKVEKETQPDIIIIGVPGGLLPVNNMHVNRFGITAFEITRAVEPDAAILSIHYNDGDEDFYNRIALMAKYRFSSELSGVLIDRTWVEFHAKGLANHVSTMRLHPDAYQKLPDSYRNFKLPIRYMPEQTDIFDLVRNKLENQTSVM